MSTDNAPPTPGQAAYEELARLVGSEYDSWEKLPGDLRAAHEAAAQAAIGASAIGGILTATKASSGDTIAITFNRPLSQRTAHEIADHWKAYAPDVTLIVVNDVAAIETRPDAAKETS